MTRQPLVLSVGPARVLRSGESMLLDALTTVLVPSHRVACSRTASADVRERTLWSCVPGNCKAERSESGGSGRPVALRAPGTYSVSIAWVGGTLAG